MACWHSRLANCGRGHGPRRRTRVVAWRYPQGFHASKGDYARIEWDAPKGYWYVTAVYGESPAKSAYDSWAGQMLAGDYYSWSSIPTFAAWSAQTQNAPKLPVAGTDLKAGQIVTRDKDGKIYPMSNEQMTIAYPRATGIILTSVSEGER